jgi:CheY-like chemotaxis protein
VRLPRCSRLMARSTTMQHSTPWLTDHSLPMLHLRGGVRSSWERTFLRNDPILTYPIMAIASALLVSADPATIAEFSLALRELSISPDLSQEATDALRLLNRRKFDAVVIDLQLGQQSGLIMDGLSLSSSNRTAVTFAIGSTDADAIAAFRRRTGFFFERPLSPQSIRGGLKPAYGLILREHQRYFRCPISNPVTILRRNAAEVSCRSLNISEGGMALSTLAPLSLGEEVQIQFLLPGCKVPFAAESKICWLKTGLLGVRFKSLSRGHKLELQEWLSRKLEEELPGFVAEQFRKKEVASALRTGEN